MTRQDASTGELVEDAQPKAKTSGKAPAKLTLHVKVYSPFKVYFEGDVDSLSAKNSSGPFDVLPKHHNFICLLNPCDLVVRMGENDKKIRIARGVMHVRKNLVTVFLDV